MVGGHTALAGCHAEKGRAKTIYRSEARSYSGGLRRVRDLRLALARSRVAGTGHCSGVDTGLPGPCHCDLLGGLRTDHDRHAANPAVQSGGRHTLGPPHRGGAVGNRRICRRGGILFGSAYAIWAAPGAPFR